MEWRVIPWLPAYEISERGDVRRRLVGGNRGIVGKVLSPSRVNGYQSIALMLPNKTQRRFMVHRLVCEAFNGPPPGDGYHVAHGDGSRDNNHVNNLRWVTPTQNEADKRRHGRTACGERQGCSKLTGEQVAAIRAARLERRGDTATLARKMGVSGTTIKHVRDHHTWRSA